MASNPPAGQPARRRPRPDAASHPADTSPSEHNTAAPPGSPAPAVLALAPGIRPLPEYELIQLLGRGGFGEVWEARGPGGFAVALKFVRLGTEADRVELRALELMKDVRHAHLLPIFGAWQQQDYLIIAMEKADRTLLDRLHEARAEGLPGIPHGELLECLREAAKGIDFLNECRHPSPAGRRVGIQHKDIKPQNLLLVGGTVKVADFGLAKLLEHTRATVSSGLTPAYAAPEFLSGKATRWSDQYCLAISYCQLRGGSLPFEGNAMEVMAGHLMDPPDLGMLPEPERPVVARALAKKPEERWPTCRAFVEALAAASAHPTAERVPTARLVTARIHRAPPPRGAGARAARPRRRGPPRLLAGVAGAALLLLVVAPVVLWRLVRTSGQADPKVAQVMRRANDSLDRQDYDAAIAGYTEALRLQPDNAEAHFNRGIAYRHKGDGDRAIADYSEAIRLEPDDAEAYFNRGIAHDDRKEYDVAIADYTEAARLKPDYAEAYYNRAVNYQSKGDNERALADYDRAIRAKPDYAEAYCNRGVAHDDSGEYEKAIADYTQALHLKPDYIKAYYNRGFAYDNVKEYERAIADYSEAIRLDPRHARAYFNRAIAYRHKGDEDRAEADRRQALELDPSLARE